ncbi:MAG: LysR family transcriptional regulator [Desulfobacteraceae bacterium]|jgi:molybdate transport system regulatory protein
MSDPAKIYGVRSKVWIVDDSGDVVFGMGRVKILRAIERTGSIHAAAKELGMSYRGVWGRIKATEERLGSPLLVRSIGGTSGGGSRLTPFAEKLIEQFVHVHQGVVREADRLLQEVFSPESASQKASTS